MVSILTLILGGIIGFAMGFYLNKNIKIVIQEGEVKTAEKIDKAFRNERGMLSYKKYKESRGM